MKKLLFTAAIAVLGLTAVNAQEKATVGGFENGDLFISGAVSFGTTSQGDTSANQVTVAPRVGFFVSDNIAVGASLGLTSRKNETKVADMTFENKTTTLEAGVFGRYYLTPASQFSFFGELAGAFASVKEEQTGATEDDKANGLTFGFAPGISYFVSDNFSIEAAVGVLGYNTFKDDVDGAEARNTFNIGVDFSNISFGVVYKF